MRGIQFFPPAGTEWLYEREFEEGKGGLIEIQVSTVSDTAHVRLRWDACKWVVKGIPFLMREWPDKKPNHVESF
jgi:hypothetical protein